MEVDGQDVAYAQSGAQLRYVGRLTDLYPVDPLAQMRVDEILETVLEMLNRGEFSVERPTTCEQARRALSRATSSRRPLAAFPQDDPALPQRQRGQVFLVLPLGLGGLPCCGRCHKSATVYPWQRPMVHP